MKIIILGPVVTNNESGGVATFDEGLFKGFKENGDDVTIISIRKSINCDNILIGNGSMSIWFLPSKFRKIAKKIRSLSPDIVICSLNYTSGIKMFKRYNPNVFFIQVLHGFPCVTDGRVKTFLITKNFKKTTRYFDETVTVSYLSYAINKKIYGVQCGRIIPNGCNFKPIYDSPKKDIDFLYVGRLTPGKNIDLIANAFLNIKSSNPDVVCCIAGYGSSEKDFLEGGSYFNRGITFLGRLSPDEVAQVMKRSKFFISMNPLEPFGIVFLEAVLSKCNIISQDCFGAASLFKEEKYFHQINALNPKELSEGLKNAIKNYHQISNDEVEEISQKYSYKRIATEYKNLFKKA